MFIRLQSNKMLNMRYLQDAFQGFHEKDVVIFYLTNGNKFTEKYETEAEAEARVAEVKEKMLSAIGGLTLVDSYADLPEKGNSGNTYIVKDIGQSYYWDKNSGTYIKIGTGGKTGVYQVNQTLSATIGAETKLNKSDLSVILKPTVDYSDGSEVIDNSSVHAIIVSSDSTTVTVKTITDMTIDSFKQANTLSNLPSVGATNVLYYIDDIDEFRIWDSTESKWVEPFHPIVFNDISVADARKNSLYIVGNVVKYTTDNANWIYLIRDLSEVTSTITFDGINDTFDLPTDIFNNLKVTINGLLNSEGTDYTIDTLVTPNTITFDMIYDPTDECILTYNKQN